MHLFFSNNHQAVFASISNYTLHLFIINSIFYFYHEYKKLKKKKILIATLATDIIDVSMTQIHQRSSLH